MYNIVTVIKLFARKMCSVLYKLLWIIPLKKKRVFFQSYEKASGFVGNPKYIAEYLSDQDKGYELVFTVRKKEDANKAGKGIKFILYHSFEWLYCLATSKTVIMNVRAPIFLSRRKGQLVINTWHAGGAYKRIGVSTEKDNKMLEYSNRQNRKYFNLFLSSSEKFTETNIREAFGFAGKVLKCGMPRNDIFFDADRIHKNNKLIRERYSLGEAFIVLVAPTFCNEGNNQNPNFIEFPFDCVENEIKKRLNKEIIFMVRKHHRDQTEYDFKKTTLDVSDYDDVQELLCAADMLITDYSSIMWDFCLLKRPILLYIPNAEKYISSDRGFYTDPHEWPGTACENPEDLNQCLSVLMSDEGASLCNRHLQKMGSYEKGNACEMVANEIYHYIL